MQARKKELPAFRALRVLETTMGKIFTRITSGEKPAHQKLFHEMIIGILQSGSTHVSKIASHIIDRCQSFHSREKRLSYQLQKSKWNESSGKVAIHEQVKATGVINEETIIAVDFSDIEKSNSHVFENLDRVHDGSSGNVVNGFWTLIIEAVKQKGEHIPLYLQMFSTKAKGFKSMNAELYKGIKEVVNNFGNLGWWVMDRGFDSSKHFAFFVEENLRFIIRGYTDRKVLNSSGEMEHILSIVNSMELPGHHPYFHYYILQKNGRKTKWAKRQTKVNYGYTQISVDTGRSKINLTLVVFEGVGKQGQRSFFYTNTPIRTLKDCLQIGKRYSLRWGCEEEIRFMKQELHLEDIRVQSYRSMQRVVFFVYATVVVLWLIERIMEEKAKTTYHWIIGLVCKRKEKPKFILYKFLEASQKIFNLKDLELCPESSILGKL